MKTHEFLTLLNENKDKSLLFEYMPGLLIGANYHITEIKNITIDSVDCGGGTDFWKETIVQIYESPEEIGKTEYMTSAKALAIFNRVDKIKPMEKEVEVKFEYSNSNFHTAQLFVNDYTIKESNLIINLGVEKTDCKAKETCGIPVTVEANANESCAPGSGCC